MFVCSANAVSETQLKSILVGTKTDLSYFREWISIAEKLNLNRKEFYKQTNKHKN